MRRIALGAFLFGVVGTASELLLLGHTESWQQWVPVTALLVGLTAVVPMMRGPSPGSIRRFRWLMIAWIVIGALGVYYHVRGNLEFELERQQSLTGLPLTWSTVTGATPTLSPGALVLLALVGFIYLKGFE